ncbi:MAG: response regulator transcription factor [Eubacteriales bacterium]
MTSKVLIVDDEKELALIVKDYLQAEGIEAYTAFNGKEAYAVFSKENIDLAVLDIMLPDDDGMEICRTLRSKSDIPIIMLSAKNSDIDKILSLGLGADEYLTKPYSPQVVVAHIKALLRRYRSQMKKDALEEHIISNNEFYMDIKKHTLEVNGKVIDIKGKEFEILWFLANRQGQVFTKEQIYDAVWGEDEFGELSTVTVHIRKIRSKFEKAEVPQYIKTIWGVGYKFEHE